MSYLSKLRKAFQGEPSIEDLQQKDERYTLELSIAEKQALIKELEAKGKKWEQFSSNGTRTGINWQNVKAFLKSNKGTVKS